MRKGQTFEKAGPQAELFDAELSNWKIRFVECNRRGTINEDHTPDPRRPFLIWTVSW